MLVKDGYLKQDSLPFNSGEENHLIEFDSLIHHKMHILNCAAETFFNHASDEIKILYQNFCKENNYWLDEYSLFLTLKKIHNGKSWNHWSDPLRKRDTTEIKKIKDKYFSEIEKTKLIQFLFHSQWEKLKNFANKRGVRIIGDLPLYVTYDSAEVWANPEL